MRGTHNKHTHTHALSHVVHSPHFQTNRYGPPEEFFKHALQYLAYTPLAGLSTTEQTEWAVDVCLSAMLGKDVYNFGSVLASPAAAPILASLSGTENAWLVELLKAFSAGDAASFKAIIAANAAVVSCCTRARARVCVCPSLSLSLSLSPSLSLILSPPHTLVASLLHLRFTSPHSPQRVRWRSCRIS